MAEKPQDLVESRHVEATLAKDKGPDARLLSWAVKDFTQKGDNMATAVTSVDVRYSLKDADRRVSYVVKINPMRKETQIDAFTCNLIKKEIHFHTVILPELNEALTSAGCEKLRIPAFYFAEKEPGRELLFFEDLRDRGFRMTDRKKGLDAAHANLVLKELARFHATSHILLARNGDLTDRYPLLKIDFATSTGQQREFLQGMFGSHLLPAINLLQEVEGYDSVLQWAIRSQQNVMDVLRDQVTDGASPFKLMCHGDCYSNNLLFRYDETGAPVEVMLLDLQVTRYASLAIDVSYLLLTSLGGSVISSSVQDFLNAYYASFSAVTEATGHPVPFSFKDLQQEFRNKLPFGLLFGLIVHPYVVMSSSDMPEAEVFLSDHDKEEVKQKILHALENNPLLRPRLLSVCDYVIREGVVD
ncbi:uncharacterized protein LOC125047086 [Penaeus chinensis]|uniref:uncharacterized protein LOC125047086 n=1 Tax=Penaeus chinensis TaxID=139456 RepID=UPI001FB65B18|nr:uncharacterized protein LOC125047086 [Penaeus chinensis]